VSGCGVGQGALRDSYEQSNVPWGWIKFRKFLDWLNFCQRVSAAIALSSLVLVYVLLIRYCDADLDIYTKLRLTSQSLYSLLACCAKQVRNSLSVQTLRRRVPWRLAEYQGVWSVWPPGCSCLVNSLKTQSVPRSEHFSSRL
jgi:hypothetical protein